MSALPSQADDGPPPLTAMNGGLSGSKPSQPGVVSALSVVPTRSAPTDTPEPDQQTDPFLARVLDGKPQEAHLCAGEKGPEGDFINTPHPASPELASKCLKISERGRDSYFAIAFYGPDTYKNARGENCIRRTKKNAIGASCWIADVDVGPDKAAAGKGYGTLEEAHEALNKFCAATLIPMPNTIIGSGSGLHLYWTTGKFIGKDKWVNFAKRLKTIFEKNGFRADPTRTADIASVLRPTGTRNYNNGGAGKPVSIIRCDDHVDLPGFIKAVVKADQTHQDHQLLELDSLPGYFQPDKISGDLGSLMTNPYGPLSDGDSQRLIEALWRLDPDMERSQWLRVIFGLKDAEANGMADAKDVARKWSMSSQQGKYNETAFDRDWASGQPERADSVHYPTILHLAHEGGWKPGVVQAVTETPVNLGMSVATGVTVIKASEIKVEPIQWLLAGWLARGKVHILAGVPGTGKTSISMALGATLTIGGRWPDGSTAIVGDILIWSAEDDPSDTLIPRLQATGADLDRVNIVASALGDDGRPRAFDPSIDMDRLSDHIATMDPKPMLLIIDPIVSAVAGDSHKNAEVRRALQPLVDLAATWKIAVLGITHFTKGTTSSDPIDRVTGSLAFAALARIVLVAAKRPDDQGGGRVLARGKSNIGKDGGGFGYDLMVTQVSPEIETTRVVWGDPISGSARDILATAETIHDRDDRSANNEASDWLKHQLAAGPQKANDMLQASKRDGISAKSLRTARNKLGVISSKETFDGGWNWHLPCVTRVVTAKSPDQRTKQANGYPNPNVVDHQAHQTRNPIQELNTLLDAALAEYAPSPPKMPKMPLKSCWGNGHLRGWKGHLSQLPHSQTFPVIEQSAFAPVISVIKCDAHDKDHISNQVKPL
ncbi:MAG: AAA family ATPase [Chromatiaceae bacterium]